MVPCLHCRQPKDNPLHAPKGIFGHELETHEYVPDETQDLSEVEDEEAWAAAVDAAKAVRMVWVVLDCWSNDPMEVRAVFSSEAAADAYIKASMEHADDYEQSRHHFQVRSWVVRD